MPEMRSREASQTEVKRRFVTQEMVERMRQLEAQGKTRAEIAEALDVDKGTVTRKLGAVRQYRGMRMPRAA